MTLGEVRAQFVGLLNRRDMTTALGTTFLKQGMARIQRGLRVPSMERMHYINGDVRAIESFEVPVDLLQIQDVYVNGLPLDKKSFREVMVQRTCNLGIISQPTMYARVGASIFLYPAMPPLSEMILTYYGEFSGLASESAENEVTASMPDLLTYAALSFAGDYFKQDRAAGWETKFISLMREETDAAIQLDMTGGAMVVSPAHKDY